jgi:hypothetical protein
MWQVEREAHDKHRYDQRRSADISHCRHHSLVPNIVAGQQAELVVDMRQDSNVIYPD